MPPPLLRARITAVALAAVVLFWQLGNAAADRFVHPFLAADLIGSSWLLLAASWPDRRTAAVALIAGFGVLFGVFSSAVTGRMLVGRFDPGTAAAALGLVPCVFGIVQAGSSSP
ncbi:hypothetical protein [Tautonia sociabilis]|uniref:Uncharacterized protein n=1 Tax=Tautonia sociabilis TaxID=2080755 RepID=A0A432MH88_9BACT|nr:hypothetical protein [Tautonia sociabilis]RUL86465.1 hypothetical protein TsocGM_15955 [Tautonia sociabilis]